MKQKQTWEIIDHLCRHCGGRVLRCVSGAGMSPGGNPLFKCACCGVSGYSASPDYLCWCGHCQKHNNTYPFMCVPFSKIDENPELLKEFLKCGCDPKNGGEVGIILKYGR